jgi:hypothetical protein
MQKRLIVFYADVENHQAFPECQLIIEQLKKLGEGDLAHMFEAARFSRMNQKVH